VFEPLNGSFPLSEFGGGDLSRVPASPFEGEGVEVRKATELDVLYEIFVHGDHGTLKSLTASAMMSLSGNFVADILVDESVAAAQKYVEFLHEALSSNRIPFPKA